MKELLYETQRIVASNNDEKIKITKPQDIEKIHQVMALKDKVQEHFIVITLNCKNVVSSIELIGIGTTNCIPINPADVIRCAVLRGATSLMLVHNHPSGDTTPSREDIYLTKKINSIASYMNVKLLDHLVLGDNILSMAEQGLMERDSYFKELENSKINELLKENKLLKDKIALYESKKESIKDKMESAKKQMSKKVSKKTKTKEREL